MALHEQAQGATDEWYTPAYVFEAMATTFDMDVAYPKDVTLPWIPATTKIHANSLQHVWHGFIWMNPPFGKRNGLIPWLDKFFDHGNGVALTPDRTSAPWWQTAAKSADAVLFVAGKIKFIDANGNPGTSPAQGTTLFASGERAVETLYVASTRRLGILFTH